MFSINRNKRKANERNIHIFSTIKKSLTRLLPPGLLLAILAIFLLIPSSAIADDAPYPDPIITTSPATAVSFDRATFNARVETTWPNYSCHLSYTMENGSESDIWPEPGENGCNKPITVSFDISNSSWSGEYWLTVDVSAPDWAGSFGSPHQSFTIPALVAPTMTVSASGISYDRITLNGAVKTDWAIGTYVCHYMYSLRHSKDGLPGQTNPEYAYQGDDGCNKPRTISFGTDLKKWIGEYWLRVALIDSYGNEGTIDEGRAFDSEHQVFALPATVLPTTKTLKARKITRTSAVLTGIVRNPTGPSIARSYICVLDKKDYLPDKQLFYDFYDDYPGCVNSPFHYSNGRITENSAVTKIRRVVKKLKPGHRYYYSLGVDNPLPSNSSDLNEEQTSIHGPIYSFRTVRK